MQRTSDSYGEIFAKHELRNSQTVWTSMVTKSTEKSPIGIVNFVYAPDAALHELFAGADYQQVLVQLRFDPSAACDIDAMTSRIKALQDNAVMTIVNEQDQSAASLLLAAKDIDVLMTRVQQGDGILDAQGAAALQYLQQKHLKNFSAKMNLEI